MPTTAKLSPTRRRTQAAFEAIYPELLSRINVLARRFPDPDEAAGEMLGFAWANFASVARRRGVFLHPGLLVWASSVRLRAGRLMTGSSVHDVHAPAAQALGRSRVIHLSALSASKRQQTLRDSTVDRIVDAVSTSEKDRPDMRAAARLDWAAFACQLPRRLRRIMQWLAIGESKTWIARRLGISKGRVSQLLDKLGREVRSFFTPELLPAWCDA